MLLLSHCSEKPTEVVEEVRQLTAAEQQLVSSGNSFGLKLFRELVAVESDTNMFVSPLSIALALGMTCNGARGETQDAMLEALELQGLTLEEMNKSYRSLIDLLRNLDSAVKFRIANSIWHEQTFQAEQEFIELNVTYFDALVSALDFSDPASVGVINSWVDESTNGKIEKILDEIPSHVIMYLINAIYFKGDWTLQFDPDYTRPDKFTMPDNTLIDCDMMHIEEEFAYLDGDGFKMLDLPYGNGAYSMTILLPDSASGVDALAEQLTDENWATWLSLLKKQELPVYLPRFELEYSIRLNDVLSTLGMGIAFDPFLADFAGINKGGDLFIDEVRHKTYVKVNEEGTEAAAVTSVSIGFTSFIPLQFRADHPFIYVIRENDSGTVLFIGKMTEPHWE